MKRLLEEDAPNQATELERMLLGSIEMDVPPEGAAAALMDRLESAPVVALADEKKKAGASFWLFLVAAAIGAFVLFLSRQRHKENVPIVQEEPLVAPVSSDLPAMEMPLPSAAPAPTPSVARSASRPAPTVSVVKRSAPAPSGLIAAAAGSRGDESAPFDKGAAARALGQVDLDECRSFDGPSGSGHVVVTFAPEGNVQHATVDPPFAGTARGACVAGKFAAARVPPFQGAPVRVGKSFVLQ